MLFLDFPISTLLRSTTRFGGRFENLDAMPRSQWPSRNGRERDLVDPDFDASYDSGELMGYSVSGAGTMIGDDDWKGFQNRW